MDRKSLIGFLLLLAIAGSYFFYANKQQSALDAQKKKFIADSVATAQTIAHAQAAQQPVPEVDSSLIGTAFVGNLTDTAIANKKIRLTFSTKGGVPDKAELKEFKTYAQQPLIFFSGRDSNRFAIKFPYQGKEIWTDSLYFTPRLTTTDNGGQQLTMTAALAPGKSIIYTYTLAPDDYMVNASVQFVGMQQELAGAQTMALNWKTTALHTEKDMKGERMYSQMHFRFGQKNKHDYEAAGKGTQKKFDEPLNWLAVRTHFFNSTIVADGQNFASGSDFTVTNDPNDTNHVVLVNNSNLLLPVTASNNYKFSFKWLLGPNDYNTLKAYHDDLEEMVPLGQGLFSFVKYISKWFILPLFDFLSKFGLNFGVIIIIMTLIIRLFLSFFTYKSYVSSAKMRLLKPEIDKLKEKYGSDQQAMGMEQMKLYRTAGVNPMGGCLPMLLQMPFLLAMYYFFPTAIQLRQSHFLWSDDLSTYDSILSWSTNIPLLSSVYGNHVSLFTLLMTASSLLLALYNKQMTAGQDVNNPALKYMPYVMPIVFLGWFNSMAAGLTFYYFFSNLISLVQQFVIQRFVIDEEKIHKKMEENRNKPAAMSKWQQKLEEMQQLQQQRGKQK